MAFIISESHKRLIENSFSKTDKPFKIIVIIITNRGSFFLNGMYYKCLVGEKSDGWDPYQSQELGSHISFLIRSQKKVALFMTTYRETSPIHLLWICYKQSNMLLSMPDTFSTQLISFPLVECTFKHIIKYIFFWYLLKK